MRAAEHLALCEAKRGGSTEQERALCEELKDAEARCKEMAKVIERYRTMAKRLIAVELEQKIEEARDDKAGNDQWVCDDCMMRDMTEAEGDAHHASTGHSVSSK